MSVAHYQRQQVLNAWPEMQAAIDEEKERARKREKAKIRARQHTLEPDAEHERRYALAALRAEGDKVAAALEGERNTTLNKAAFALGQLIAAGALEREEVEDDLLAAARACGLSEREANAVIKSGIEAGMKEPRVMPESTIPNKCGSESNGRAKDRLQLILPVDLHEQVAAVVRALHGLNDPPSIFQRGRELVRVVRIDGKPGIDTFTAISLRAYVQSKLELLKLNNTGERVPTNMSQDLAGYILAADEWPFPPLDSIIYAPTITKAGELVTTPGYSSASRTYLDLGGFAPPAVPAEPTPAEVQCAVSLILDELLADFPLVDDASRANALALGLQPYTRPAIEGPTPLFGSDGTTPGTGKSLLVEKLCFIATGLDPKVMTEGRDDDEWRKRITSTLLEAPAVVMIDNVNRRLDSGALSAVLTSRYWTDRLLGQTRNTTLPNMATWVATGNNLVTSNEIARRLVWIRLDAKVEQPWKRSGFKHDPPGEWVKANRNELVSAFLTIIQNWVAKGRPKGSKTLGSYEAWAAITGGILEAAGVKGFLGNLDQLYDRADEEAREWREFINVWFDQYKQNPVTVADLHELATEHDMLLTVLGDKGERSQKTRLGRAVGKREGRIMGEYRLEREQNEKRSGVGRYFLRRMGRVTSGAEL